MNPDEKAKDKLCKILMNCKILSTQGRGGEGGEMSNASGTVTVMRIFRLFKKRLKLNLHLRFFYVSCS